MHSLAHTMTRQAWACLREPQEQRLSVSLLKQLTTSVKDDFNNLCEIHKKTAPAKGENSKFVLPSNTNGLEKRRCWQLAMFNPNVNKQLYHALLEHSLATLHITGRANGEWKLPTWLCGGKAALYAND